MERVWALLGQRPRGAATVPTGTLHTRWSSSAAREGTGTVIE
jgi:hypothetical protein